MEGEGINNALPTPFCWFSEPPYIPLLATPDGSMPDRITSPCEFIDILSPISLFHRRNGFVLPALNYFYTLAHDSAADAAAVTTSRINDDDDIIHLNTTKCPRNDSSQFHSVMMPRNGCEQATLISATTTPALEKQNFLASHNFYQLVETTITKSSKIKKNPEESNPKLLKKEVCQLKKDLQYGKVSHLFNVKMQYSIHTD